MTKTHLDLNSKAVRVEKLAIRNEKNLAIETPPMVLCTVLKTFDQEILHHLPVTINGDLALFLTKHIHVPVVIV